MRKYALLKVNGTDPESVEVLSEGTDVDELYFVRDELQRESLALGATMSEQRFAVKVV